MTRRIVSLWFPRLAAERLLRRMGAVSAPFAVVGAERGALRLVSLCAGAQGAGLARGMGLADARAICPSLLTRPAEPDGEAAFLAALARWALRYTPWVGVEGADGLTLDVSGCAHLFGGEAAMLADMVAALAAQGVSARAACADTRGAAWALARFAPGAGRPALDGDAIAAEARATRARAAARPSWSRNAAHGTAPWAAPVVAPAGGARAALAALPVAALRIAPQTAAALTRLGLGAIGDLAGLPRGAVARRFGLETVRRLDQALGAEPEPVAVARAAPRFAVRLSLPDPIGRVEDVAAGLARLLARLCATLAAHGMGAGRLRLSLRRVDRSDAHLSVGLARPSRDAAVIAALFERPLTEVDAGFGIDALRLEAVEVEPLAAAQHKGPLGAGAPGGPLGADAPEGDAFALLLGRLGGRLGFERLARFLPADSHIPGKAFTIASAAHAAPHAGPWPRPSGLRPLEIWTPEPAIPEPEDPAAGPPQGFRWRGRSHRVACAFGPERIAPEWWLDDPDWRTGPRDYWRVETEAGARLWLFCAPRSTRLDRWFVEGAFA